jgi:hypothetical protein
MGGRILNGSKPIDYSSIKLGGGECAWSLKDWSVAYWKRYMEPGESRGRYSCERNDTA